MKDRKALVDKVVKLFNLGKGGGTEAEMMSAMTAAKEMMLRHQLSEAEVQQALNARAAQQHAAPIDISQYTAYTRKIKRFARYDEILAMAVGRLTMTEPILISPGYGYLQMTFIGVETDIRIAADLFLILLQKVRRRAREEFGHGKNDWTKQHTSYAIGFTTRLLDRAKAECPQLSLQETNSVALMLRNKETAIHAYKRQRGIAEGKARKINVDRDAYIVGYADGQMESLNKKGLR